MTQEERNNPDLKMGSAQTHCIRIRKKELSESNAFMKQLNK